MPRRVHPLPAFAALRDRQHGVLSLGQLRACGVTEPVLRDRLARGIWQRVLPRVYVTDRRPLTRDQRSTAALLYAAPNGALDGLSALASCGVGYLPPDDGRVRVVVPAYRHLASRDFVVVRRTTGRVARGVVALPQAVVAAGIELDDVRAVRAIVAEVVQRRLASLDELEVALAAAPRRGSAHLRRALADVGAGVRSAPEAEFRDLVGTSRLIPEPRWNPALLLPDGSQVSPDAYWEEAALVHEVDSRQHHGYAEPRERTMRRHSRMTAAGLTVLHTSPRRLRVEPDAVLAEVDAAYRLGRVRGPAVGVVVLGP